MTPFELVYDDFLDQITQDMYMQITEEETKAMLKQLLLTAIPQFQFPRVPLDYGKQEKTVLTDDGELETKEKYYFLHDLNHEEIHVLGTYMIVAWLGQQLATIQLVRMKYSGSDFKFSSQANHIQKVLALKKDYQREGLHLQRLYKRRIKDVNGIYHSTFGKIMEAPASMPQKKGDASSGN